MPGFARRHGGASRGPTRARALQPTSERAASSAAGSGAGRSAARLAPEADERADRRIERASARLGDLTGLRQHREQIGADPGPCRAARRAERPPRARCPRIVAHHSVEGGDPVEGRRGRLPGPPLRPRRTGRREPPCPSRRGYTRDARAVGRRRGCARRILRERERRRHRPHESHRPRRRHRDVHFPAGVAASGAPVAAPQPPPPRGRESGAAAGGVRSDHTGLDRDAPHGADPAARGRRALLSRRAR